MAAGRDERVRSGQVPGVAEADAHVGAIEGDRPADEQQYNHNVPALDEEGLPSDEVSICEDVLGANADETEG